MGDSEKPRAQVWFVLYLLLVSVCVSLVELIDSAARLNSLLLSGVERMALRANVHLKDVTLLGRAGNELGPASAYALCFMVIGMYLLFHNNLSCLISALLLYR